MLKKKTNIIEQLEQGKELLESGEINVDSLKTKINSEDEESKEKPKRKRKISKDNTSDDNFSNNSNDKVSDNQLNDNNSSDNILAESNNQQPKEQKVEKYPGFDFTTMYSKGQIIFYVKINPIVGEKELQELKLHTIYPKMLIGCIGKAYTQCIGPDTADRVFTDRKEAIKYYKSVVVKQRVYSSMGDLEDDE